MSDPTEYRNIERLADIKAKDMSVSSTNGVSPRKIYDSWPAAELAAVREELKQAASTRAALVAKALGGATAAGGS